MGKTKSFPKPNRIIDLALVRKIKEMPCRVCDAPPPNDCDHIQSRGAGGGDEITNVWALCRFHHMERHRWGIKRFVEVHNLPVSFELGYPKLILSSE